MEATTTTEWEQSESVNELFGALAKAQAEIEGAEKGKVNPAFRSKYADLSSVWEACRAPLSKNGLCVIQQPFTRGNQAGLRTQLGHSSGQWVACVSTTTPKDGGPQALGSCITYLRRYGLSAFVGVCPEDDDGEKAEGRDRDARPPGANWNRPKPAPAPKRQQDPADDGTPISAGTLQAVRLAAGDKFKGKPADAKKWLAENFGTDNPETLSEFEGKQAAQLMHRAA